MASVVSQLIEEVTVHAQSYSLDDAREICAESTYRITHVHGSVHREWNLIIVFQQDATYSVYYISVDSSTSLEC